MDIRTSYSGNDTSHHGDGMWEHYGRKAREALLDETVTLEYPGPLTAATMKAEPSQGALSIGEPSGGTVALTFGSVGRYVVVLRPAHAPAVDLEFFVFEVDALDSVLFKAPRRAPTAPCEFWPHYSDAKARRMVLRALANHPNDPAYTGLTDDLRLCKLAMRY